MSVRYIDTLASRERTTRMRWNGAEDQIVPGQEFDVERLDRGEYRLVRLSGPANEGVLEWLLACPEKDLFVAIESESTDSL